MPHFTVFFRPLPAVAPARRIALLRQFSQSGMGAEVAVVTEAFFPDRNRYSGIVVVSASSVAPVRTALVPAEAAFTCDVVPCTHAPAPGSGDPAFCILSPVTATAASPAGGEAVAAAITCPEGHDLLEIVFARADLRVAVREWAAARYGDRGVPVFACLSSGAYLERLTRSAATPAVATTITDPAPRYRVKNTGKTAFWINSLSPERVAQYYANPRVGNIYKYLLDSRYQLQPGETYLVQQKVYCWRTLQEPLVYQLSQPPYGSGPDVPISNGGAADASYAASEASVLTIRLENNRFIGGVMNEVTQFLDKLLRTDQLDAAWPEDAYTGAELAAYNFILSGLRKQGIDAAPKNGNVEAANVEAVTFTDTGNFDKGTFTGVKDHLLAEIGYFGYAATWFGPSGIFATLYNSVASLSGNDLTNAANLLGIPEHKSVISMILDAVFGDIIAIVKAIPGVGPFIGAALQVGYNTARTIIAAAGQPTGTSIQESVADMAETLNKYLTDIISANNQHYATVTGNYGRLRAFAEKCGAKDPMFNAKSFGFAPGTGSAPRAYLTTVDNAWAITIFKSLLSSNAKYAPETGMDFADTPPALIPAANPGRQTTYYLPCVYKGNSKNIAGYLLLTRSATINDQTVHRLLSPDELAIDPMDYYCGIGGWPRPKKFYVIADGQYDPIVSVGV